MPPRSLQDELLASVDPVKGRRLLDQMECGGVRRRGRSRRISARLVPPGESFQHWAQRQGYGDLAARLEDRVHQ